MCVYTVITNGFSSFHCSCTILKSRGQRYPCHFLCQRSWVTCGKDIDQGRLIYVPAIVSTVDFLFLFMSCALFLRSRICVRWNSTARQLRKSGEDYDILHTFYWSLPHSVWQSRVSKMVLDKDGVSKRVCQRWCVKEVVWQSRVSKMLCDKVVCERWCVTKWCVKDGVTKLGVKDGVWKMVCERWCVTDGVWQRWCVKDGVW